MSGLTGNSLHLLLCLLCYYDVLLLLVMSLYIVLPLLCIVLSWLCNHMDCCPPGSSVQEILQARILSGLPCPPPGDLPDIYIYVDICVCVCVCVCVCIYTSGYIYTHTYICILKFFLVEVSEENLAEYIYMVGQRRSILISLFRKLWINLYTRFWQVIVS